MAGELDRGGEHDAGELGCGGDRTELVAELDQEHERRLKLEVFGLVDGRRAGPWRGARPGELVAEHEAGELSRGGDRAELVTELEVLARLVATTTTRPPPRRVRARP